METEEKEGKLMPSSGRKLKRYDEDLEIVTTTPAADGDEIDPYTYLQVIWRHKNACLIFFFAVIATAILVSILTKPMYMATSTVEIALQNPNIVNFREVGQVNTSDPAFFNTQRDLIKSRAMAEAVLAKFNLWDHPDFEVSQTNFNPISIIFSYMAKTVRKFVKPVEDTTTQLTDGSTQSGEGEGDGSVDSLGEYDPEKIKRDSVINTFLSRILVEPSADSRLITISFQAYSPKFAAQMADAIADTFVEWSQERRLEATRSAREFLQKQLAEVKANVQDSEQALYQFLAKNEIIGLDKNMSLIYRQLDELQKSLAQAATEKTTKESVYKSVKSGNPDAITEVMSDPIIQGLKKQYNDLLIQYSDLSAIFKPEYPPLKKLQAQVEAARTHLNEATKRKIAALEADYQTVSRREELLKERVKEQEKLAMTLNEKTIQYNILDREVQTNKTIYDSLLQRLKETDVTGGMRSTGIQVVDHAFIPRTPIMPNIPRNLLLAFIAGLIGAIGVAFVREFFDRTIRTPEEIREKMRLPVLGSLFKLEGLKNNAKYMTSSTEKLYLADPRSPFSEAIRTIRASILLSSRDRSVRSVLVTSCWPGEGKTTVASNLALSLAYGANKVLLVEADLRHPGVARNFGIDESKPGLSDYLMSHFPLAEIIYPTEIPQLSILPSGSIISNPSELLQSEVMNQLLTGLKEDYDYIVIDSSPAIGLADSLVISTVVDATVVVASTGMTMRRDISYLVKQMSDINARFLGIVVNRVDMGRENYYYYDRYYKGYYGRDVETVKDAEDRMVKQHQKSEFDETGKLDENSYARLLCSYFRDKKTGILSIDSKLKLRVYFLEGFPVFVEGGDSRTRLGNIAFSEKKIGKEEYAKVLEKVTRTKRKIGEVLIEMGFISPHELDWLLEFQVKEKLIRGFECTTGTYGFQSRADFVDNILTYKANPLQIMYEGIKRYADPVQLEKQFLDTTVGNAMVTSEPEIVESLRNVGFSPREYRFLQHLSRGNVISDISSSNLLPRDDMLKLMYFLRSTGFVKFEEAKNAAENQNAI
ncbi:MAG TPA: polysaccharide biosynthesis tyrosine autokinase [Thermodesulfobacteriota bacterium]|nr:polysaccharide biosynthesis tyrosine autokinase [Thermodesulfobacteriota bacterium]